jgi:phenylalanyl-tRNA synthetase beta chain
MKVSLNWIKEYTKVDMPIDKLIEKIGSQLGAIEEVINLGKKYKGALIVRIKECKTHPNADKLHVCWVDDNKMLKGIPRNKDGFVQVVCGANNVETGQTVIWLPPGMVVPETSGDKPFKLEVKELRGVKSYGMIASAKELGFGDDHEGIVVLKENINPGTDLVKEFNLNDYIIDIENKMFTHRPDCFGILGVAREISGILGNKFTSPDWYSKNTTEKEQAFKKATNELPFRVINQAPELVARFCAVSVKDLNIAPSPPRFCAKLAKVGIKPINSVVDITNYAMVLTGQPLHAYDFDKVKKLCGDKHVEIIVRQAKKGEDIKLLGGKQAKMSGGELVIATPEKPIGIAGIMGGADTEVDASTKNIILECANFDMYSIRKTAFAHGLFTDAFTRFSKDQSPLQNRTALTLTADMICGAYGGKISNQIIDDDNSKPNKPVEVSTDLINNILGTELSSSEIANILKNVEFGVETIGSSKLKITPPFWRTDIKIAEDIIEEVGRLYGYDKLKLILPIRDLAPAAKNQTLELKKQLRQTLKTAGANELLNYSFVHGNLLDKTGQDKKLAYQLSNALSPDLQYYRLSILPSLLEKVHPNIKAGHSQFAIYEIGKIHIKKHLNQEGLPQEDEHLALVFAADKKAAAKYSNVSYYQALTYLDYLLKTFGINYSLLPMAEKSGSLAHSVAPLLFAKTRSAFIIEKSSGQIFGAVGEFKQAVKKSLKLPDFCAGFELQIDQLKTKQNSYTPLSKYPKVQQDMSLKVPNNIAYGDLFDLLKTVTEKLKPASSIVEIEPLDIYQPKTDKTLKHVAFGFTVLPYERTMKASEVNELLDHIATGAKQKFGAKRI